MNENGKSDRSPEGPAEPLTTTLKVRFISFALCHIALSFVFLAALVKIIPMVTTSLAPSTDGTSGIPLPPFALLTALGVALYFPVGMLAAKRGNWAMPTRREKLLTIAQTFGMLISSMLLFCWGAIGIAAVFTLPFVGIFGFLAALPTCLTLCLTPFVRFLWMLGFLPAALLSALLPPLLFGLGSFWQAKRQNSSPPT